ncbi:saccharopine dehydrogenase family protein [Paenibacillus sp. PAMC21692]|uniref:saccharopine dehydrogenase family protein n=1 Tax=Paenibacillus sp. PAMC21692 TaxID=2762320 RepID=UPI00164D7898|nr:saccharopine dehydrogenase NADP-binding domain-containing protein [Paenibacillus sp. PAMC21692]QNK55010.1 saccharopine dehydrogenase NADP-binding domain-containing protein [Paenibacillus sp. PAMC21692]
MYHKIIVIGGYGKVGGVICDELRKRYPYRVYAAGRSLEKAERFSRAMNGEVLPLEVDVDGGVPENWPDGVSVVIMCLDVRNISFIAQCLEKGIHYIDVTADYSVMERIQRLPSHSATTVLSVGLAPGITNMLVKRGVQQLDQADAADIFLLLGLGEKHGRKAVEWTVDNFNAEFAVIDKGQQVEFSGFSDGLQTEFNRDIGRRSAYRFNFSDQHILPGTLHIPTVSTRLCFDSRFVTWLLAASARLRITRLLLKPGIRNKVVDSILNTNWGKEIYAVKVEVSGQKDGRNVRYHGVISGDKEFHMTGQVAAYVARCLYEEKYPRGVFHIEELFQPDELFASLSHHFTLEERIGYK